MTSRIAFRSPVKAIEVLPMLPIRSCVIDGEASSATEANWELPLHDWWRIRVRAQGVHRRHEWRNRSLARQKNY